ncbi:MAG: hypothetical protein M3R37_00565 [Actinomycetota bacterium]|nr:hypothetical protein [Actinomycetota bacterium]
MRASLVLLVGLLCASACVTVSISAITPSPSPTGSLRPVSAGKGFGLVPSHDGQMVTVDADTDIVRLVLDDGWAWDVVVDASYLRLTGFGPLYGNGFTAQYWTYKLLQTGETKVTATGVPTCRGASFPCSQPDRLYSVTLQTR